MPKIGEKPGKGIYRCQSCGQSVTLKDDTEALPLCPRCGFGGFTAFRPKGATGTKPTSNQ